jgi:hypothetical protein
MRREYDLPKAVSMDALAERCFQLGANRQMRRIKEQHHLLARARGNEARRLDAVGCFSISLIALGLLLVWTFISADIWVGFVLSGGFAGLIYKLYKKIRAGGPGAGADAFVQRWKNRTSVKQGVAAYGRGEPWAVARVHEYAVEEFRNRVAEHRERTLGDNSEWGRARASLVEAASEAQRSSAYWAARLRQEPSNELAKSQKDVSDRLQAKLAEAFEKLEARSVALRRFYNECDARLAAMDRRNRDLEESRRLGELSGRADVIIAHAEGTIHALATSFVTEARAFADPLGGVAAVSITSLAGEAPVDDIDYFADQIIEDSDRDRAAIEDLERRLAP